MVFRTSFKLGKKGILPIFKINAKAVPEVLVAAVGFIEENLMSPQQAAQTAMEEFRRIMTNHWEDTLEEHRHWFKLTFIFVALSISLLLAGAIVAIFWDMQVGTLTSISSILTSTISALLYSQLHKTQKNVEKNQEQVARKFKEASERYYGVASTSED